MEIVLFYWVRELAGWFLILAGLLVFFFCLGLMEDRKVVEAGIAAGVGIFVFRGGIHLVKVATAARVVLAARRDRGRKAPVDGLDLL